MVSTAILKEWSESPRTLIESLAWQAVEDGQPGRSINWKGATKEPFLSMEGRGAVKLELVARGEGCNVTVHFWQEKSGERSHLKVKTT